MPDPNVAYRDRIGSPVVGTAPRLLLLGSGELGREIALEAMRLGAEVIAVDRYPNAPAMQVAHRHHVIPMTDPAELRAVVEREAPDVGAATVEPGDVLFGKLRPYLAKTWLVDRPVYASTELLCLRPHAGVDSRWLAHVLRSNRIVGWAMASSDGTKM